MHALLALSKKNVREMVAFALEARYRITLTEVQSAKKAIHFLEENKVDLVICEHQGIGDVLFKHLASMDRAKTATPVIICAMGKPKKDPVISKLTVQGYAHFMNIIDDLYAILDNLAPKISDEPITLRPDLVSDKKTIPEDEEDPAYIRIKTILLTRVGQLHAGVYIQLSKSHYVKLFRDGDVFDQKDYARYMTEKGLEYFYLRTHETTEFVSKFKLELLELLGAELMAPDTASEISQAVHETVQELISRVGLTPELQDLVKSNIQLSMKSMGRSPKLHHVIKALIKDPKRYISSHSIMLAELSCSLAKAMEWNSETTFHKLNLASFLHDMSLKNQALAAVEDMSELLRKKTTFTTEELKAYQLHTATGAELARQFTELPPEVDTIIMQHHELPDGSGFPRGLTHTQISPLASLFIVAHDVIWNAIHNNTGDKKFDMKNFLAESREKYSMGNFKKIHKCLSEIKV